jgi:hypothetical protein
MVVSFSVGLAVVAGGNGKETLFNGTELFEP